MSALQLQAQNIKCGGCASTIQNGLGDLPQVEAVEVDIATGIVRIQGQELDADRIRAKLAELGYPVAQDE
ncbi:MAG: heavy-metal-associated domain-containing protein [Gammaproteobacteria bacterium]